MLLKTSLFKITKSGYRSSYIKGIVHNKNNFCTESLKRLTKSKYLVFETSKKRVHDTSSEDIIYKYSEYYNLKEFRLDSKTKKYRQSKKFGKSFHLYEKNKTLRNKQKRPCQEHSRDELRTWIKQKKVL